MMWSGNMYVTVVLCTMLSTTVYTTSAQDCMYQPGEYNTQIVEEFGCVLLDCRNLTINSTEYAFDGWILPSVDYINSTYADSKVIVDDEDWTLTVYNVSREDTGLYHCMLLMEGEYYLVRMGINIKGPFFISGWEEYQDNTIIGLVAFAGFLVLTGAIYLMYYCRFQSDEEDDEDYGKMAIDAYAKDAGDVVISRQSSVASVPNYMPAQDNPDLIKTAFSDVSEIRKRSPATEKKLEANANKYEEIKVIVSPEKVKVTMNATGVDNPAFDGDKTHSVISDEIVDEFFSGIGDDDKADDDDKRSERSVHETPDTVETTEL